MKAKVTVKEMMMKEESYKVRFKKTSNPNESVFVIGEHTITRYVSSGTRGEWMYNFCCSCGWLSRNMIIFPELYRTNRIALRHIRTIMAQEMGKSSVEIL